VISSVADTLWLGRVLIPGETRQRPVRVWTGGAAPGPDDVLEEIPDPFALAQPSTGASSDTDVARLGAELDIVSGGLRCPVRDVELAPPVRPPKIVCVGRNYRAHAEEMGNEVPDEPLLFFKPASALLAAGAPLPLPGGYERIDMEAELVAIIGRTGRKLTPSEASSSVVGYTLGNDVSCRDLQRRDKQWTRAKGFDGFAPLGPWIRVMAAGTSLPSEARIQGFIDDHLVQDAALSDMIFDIGFVLAYLSACMTLEPGDAIYTGTPSGVSPLAPGRTTAVQLAGFDLGRLSNRVVGFD
jgi:2-keto-4-pentenoate hydratase/2-oxohepta-3-ene-1,7-dioic acid hydratase in catechol pathway